MRMESASHIDLLKSHLSVCYAGKDTLVADLNDVEYLSEINALFELLDEHGCTVPAVMKTPGWLIVELNQAAAMAICNHFDKRFTRIFVFHGGECIHENM